MNVRKVCCLGGDEVGVMLSVVIAVKSPEIRVTFVDAEAKNTLKWNPNTMMEGNNDTGLCSLLRKVKNKNLYFTANKADSIHEAEIIFIVTNADVKSYGEGKGTLVDTSSIMSAAQLIADSARTDKIIVECSCLPLNLNGFLNEFFSSSAKPNVRLQPLMSPIFFDRKFGLKSVLFPDRVSIGHDESGLALLAEKTLSLIYGHWLDPSKIVVKKATSLEIAQIASYALTAQKIASLYSLKKLFLKNNHSIAKFSTFMQNEFRSLGLPDVTPNVGKFCNAIRTLFYICKEHDLTETLDYWKATLRIFASEEIYNLEILLESLNVPGMTVTVYGFAEEDVIFPELTHDLTEILLDKGFRINIHDPKVSLEFVQNIINWKPVMPRSVKLIEDPCKAAEDSQLILIHSYHKAWLDIDWKQVFQVMKKPAHIFDHFHMLQEAEVASIGFQVYDFFPNILKTEGSKC